MGEYGSPAIAMADPKDAAAALDTSIADANAKRARDIVPEATDATAKARV
jgi:hypothetical protein